MKQVIKHHPQCRACKSVDTDPAYFCKLTGRDLSEYDPEDDCVNAVKVREGYFIKRDSVNTVCRKNK